MRPYVKIISKKGSTSHEWIEDWNQNKLWNSFKARGIFLPDYNSIPNKSELRLLMNVFRFKFEEHHRDGSIDTWLFVFKPGFIWDLASVPHVLRGIVDNDSRSLRAAAMVHDTLFALHLVGFVEADRLFYRIIRAHSGGFKGFLAYIAVRSPIGRNIYNDHNSKTHWMSGFVEVYKNGDKI